MEEEDEGLSCLLETTRGDGETRPYGRSAEACLSRPQSS